jgi:hypothetical protein
MSGSPRAAGSWRAPLLAGSAIVLAAGSWTRYLPGSPTAAGGTLAGVALVLETAALLVAIAATLLGDEITRRGRLGRRLGMVIVVAVAVVHLAGAAGAG